MKKELMGQAMEEESSSEGKTVVIYHKLKDEAG